MLDTAAMLPNSSGEFQSGGDRIAKSIDSFTAPKPLKKSSRNTA